MIPLWADLTAVGLGGIQGALFASGFQGERRLDLMGVAIIGIVMGMGGGIIRDLLLNTQLATLQNDWYLLTATAAAIIGMLLAGVFQRLNGAIVALDAVVLSAAATCARSGSARSMVSIVAVSDIRKWCGWSKSVPGITCTPRAARASQKAAASPPGASPHR